VYRAVENRIVATQNTVCNLCSCYAAIVCTAASRGFLAATLGSWMGDYNTVYWGFTLLGGQLRLHPRTICGELISNMVARVCAYGMFGSDRFWSLTGDATSEGDMAGRNRSTTLCKAAVAVPLWCFRRSALWRWMHAGERRKVLESSCDSFVGTRPG